MPPQLYSMLELEENNLPLVFPMKEDSITGIYDTLKDCAQISKFAGGIGLHVHNIRANGSYIAEQMEQVMVWFQCLEF